jgi:hypothetical protein
VPRGRQVVVAHHVAGPTVRCLWRKGTAEPPEAKLARTVKLVLEISASLDQRAAERSNLGLVPRGSRTVHMKFVLTGQADYESNVAPKLSFDQPDDLPPKPFRTIIIASRQPDNVW